MVFNFFTKDELKGLAIIFLILIAISVPNFVVSIKRSRDVTRKNDIRDIAEAANMYHEEFQKFPANIDDLSGFLPAVPRDPESVNGVDYIYLSNGSRYQVYASLEDKKQDEYEVNIEKRNISCGARICNFGRAYGETPLDKSLEEYENEIYAN